MSVSRRFVVGFLLFGCAILVGVTRVFLVVGGQFVDTGILSAQFAVFICQLPVILAGLVECREQLVRRVLLAVVSQLFMPVIEIRLELRQKLFGCSVLPLQPSATLAKSPALVPPTVTLPIASGAVPVLATVTVSGGVLLPI